MEENTNQIHELQNTGVDTTARVGVSSLSQSVLSMENISGDVVFDNRIAPEGLVSNADYYVTPYLPFGGWSDMGGSLIRIYDTKGDLVTWAIL